MPQQDLGTELQQQVEQAYQQGQALKIVSGNSKAFYGERVGQGQNLELSGHSGIIDYDPAELVVTVRAGTPLSELNAVLAEQGQMLGFEPPHFSERASIGGCVACGLSGPARPFLGAVRDHVLGCRIINGKGELLNFGGRVIKNVAGYDVSRLMTGAMGSLGVILDISLKTLPLPEQELTLAMPTGIQEALDVMNARASKPLPLTGLAFDGEAVLQRLAGSAEVLKQARRKIAGDEITSSRQWWLDLREQNHFFFQQQEPLWRLSLSSETLPLGLPGRWFFEWGGAVRWLQSSVPAHHIRAAVEAEGGHACLFRNDHSDGETPVFHPLTPALLAYHRRLKQTFDPAAILNPGRLYREL